MTKKEELKESAKKINDSFTPKEKLNYFLTRGIAKKITLSMAVITFIIGIVGSWEKIPLDMDDYTNFVESFGMIYFPIILSIGAAKIAKNFKEKSDDKQTQNRPR